MQNQEIALSEVSKPRGNSSFRSRRAVLAGSAIAGLAGALGVSLLGERAIATTPDNNKNDAAILNNALFYEHQAIWTYSFAAGKLTNTQVGKAVLALGLRNQNDHKQHRDVLAFAVKNLGGTPVQAESSYDLSSYINQKEGNIDTDVNIAKLALALETDAAIAYTLEAAKLKTPALIVAGASIATTEAAHAAAIRATFKALGMNLEIVPTAFVSNDNRKSWVLTV